MTGFAVAVGFGYLVITLFIISGIVAGWRRSGKGLVVVLLIGSSLLALWLWFMIGVSPFEPTALMSLLSVLMAGIGAFLIGFLAARLLRKRNATRTNTG